MFFPIITVLYSNAHCPLLILSSQVNTYLPFWYQGSRAIGQLQKHVYNFNTYMDFGVNANCVFWLCPNSWFWVWKKDFSITIFHEKKLPFSVAPFILHLNHSKRAFEALPWLQKAIWQKWVFVAKACHKCSVWVL